MERAELKPVIESLIFASDAAITLERICGVLEGEEREAIKTALAELIDDYRTGRRGFLIEEVAGGYVFRTNHEFAPWLRRLFKTGAQKISKAAMESLAIVAYKQPITRGELESVRGVDSGGVIATLMEKRLIKITGRKDAPGRPAVYGTTKEFLESFDLNDLSCLPSLKEMQKAEEEDAPQKAVGEASENNSEGGDNLKTESGGTDPGGEGQGEPEGSRPAGDKGRSGQ